MNKYKIRFNHMRGQPGRGTVEHVWRVFENDKEYIFKNVKLNVTSEGELEKKTPKGCFFRPQGCFFQLALRAKIRPLGQIFQGHEKRALGFSGLNNASREHHDAT